MNLNSVTDGSPLPHTVALASRDRFPKHRIDWPAMILVPGLDRFFTAMIDASKCDPLQASPEGGIVFVRLADGRHLRVIVEQIEP